jgi:hypothetical protein
MSSTTTEQPGVPVAPGRRDGFVGWISTTDHKKIGIMYFWTVLVFFFLGGVESGFIRWQLGQAEQTVLTERSTTSSSRCTASPWCSWWSCRSPRRSSTT